MEKPEWHRLPHEQAAEVMRAIGANADAAVFSKQLTEVACRTLPFYKNFKLYRLTNYATMPCFTMDYLGNPDNDKFYTLDGLANTLYDVNDDDHIELTFDTVVAYLDFFFAQVQGPDGDIYLIKSPEGLPMLGSLPENQQNSVREHFQHLITEADPDNEGFKITGTVFYGGSLISAHIAVHKRGLITIKDQTLLLQGVHFPNSPIEHKYMSD